MTTSLHHCIKDASQIINVVAPVTPLWVVVQSVTALNDEETAPAFWSDWIFPVHAIGTIPPRSLRNYQTCSGAFLVADPSTGVVAWLSRCNGYFKPERLDKPVIRVFFVDEKPERQQHPCPSSWGAEYDPTQFECDIFC